MGGANIAQQFVRARLLDEIRLHLVPLLIGSGTRLFEGVGGGTIELEPIRIDPEPGVTHLRYRVRHRPRDLPAKRCTSAGRVRPCA
jgi:riboflavin biosynthesis pyrimidine reductase